MLQLCEWTISVFLRISKKNQLKQPPSWFYVRTFSFIFPCKKNVIFFSSSFHLLNTPLCSWWRWCISGGSPSNCTWDSYTRLWRSGSPPPTPPAVPRRAREFPTYWCWWAGWGGAGSRGRPADLIEKNSRVKANLNTPHTPLQIKRYTMIICSTYFLSLRAACRGPSRGMWFLWWISRCSSSECRGG